MASGGELEERVRQGMIERLQKRSIVELEQVRRFHEWLDDKRVSRQSGRVVFMSGWMTNESRGNRVESWANPARVKPYPAKPINSNTHQSRRVEP